MGDRVQAEIWVYPLDLEVAANTEAETTFRAALLEVLDNEGAEDHDISLAGVNYWLLRDVNYGTSRLEQVGLGDRAVDAGLWYAQADEGSVEWGPHGNVYVPTLDRVFSWDFGALSVPVLPADRFTAFDAAGHVEIRTRSYFRLAGLNLDQWAEIGELELAELLDETLSPAPVDRRSEPGYGVPRCGKPVDNGTGPCVFHVNHPGECRRHTLMSEL
jgi:hypothetical protein